MAREEFLTATSQVLTAAYQSPLLTPDRLSPEITDSFRNTWKEAIKGISLPAWCEPAKLIDCLSNETEEYYLENQLANRLERIWQLSKNYGDAFVSFSYAIDDYSKAMAGVLQREIESKPVSLYRSDLPLSLISKLNLLKHTQAQAYGTLAYTVRSFINKAAIFNSNRIKFRMHVTTPYSKSLEPLSKAFNESDRTGSALLAYLRVWSANSYGDLTSQKPLSLAKVDKREYSELYDAFETNLYRLRDSLVWLAPDLKFGGKKDLGVTSMLGELLLGT